MFERGYVICNLSTTLVAYAEENSLLSEQSVITSSTDNVASGSDTLDKSFPPSSMEPGNNLSDQVIEAELPKPKYR